MAKLWILIFISSHHLLFFFLFSPALLPRRIGDTRSSCVVPYFFFFLSKSVIASRLCMSIRLQCVTKMIYALSYLNDLFLNLSSVFHFMVLSLSYMHHIPPSFHLLVVFFFLVWSDEGQQVYNSRPCVYFGFFQVSTSHFSSLWFGFFFLRKRIFKHFIMHFFLVYFRFFLFFLLTQSPVKERSLCFFAPCWGPRLVKRAGQRALLSRSKHKKERKKKKGRTQWGVTLVATVCCSDETNRNRKKY